MGQPVESLTAHRMRAGHHPAANVTSPTYDFASFPEQTDQDAEIERWAFDTTRSVPPHRRVVQYADDSAGEDGEYEFELVIDYLSKLMLKYIHDTFFAGGARSAPMTVMTYTDTDQPIFVQCTWLRPTLPGDGEATFGGWRGVKFRFIGGAVVT